MVWLQYKCNENLQFLWPEFGNSYLQPWHQFLPQLGLTLPLQEQVQPTLSFWLIFDDDQDQEDEFSLFVIFEWSGAFFYMSGIKS